MMDWTEKERCVLCDRGGKLLVCADDGCPISVHKNCMGCKARFNDVGNFYCPYCVYRRLTTETCQLRDKAILAKKALSTFLGEKMRDGNHEEPKPGMASEKEQILSTDKTCLGSMNNLVSDDVENQSIHLAKHQKRKSPLPCEETHETSVSEQTDGFPNRHGEISGVYNGNTCRIMVVYEAHADPIVACGVDHVLPKEKWTIANELESGVCKRVRVEDRTESAECKDDRVADDRRRATSKEKAPQPNNVVTRQERKHSEALNRTGNRRAEECMMEHTAKNYASLTPGLQLRPRPNRQINSNDLGSRTFSKQQRHLRHRPTHVLDPLHGATKGSLEAVIGRVSCPEIINSNNSGEVKDACKQLSILDRNAKPPSLRGKRRVRWSEEEEDMLKEGVQKFSSMVHKNLPWKKVLEFGHHVFDPSRTPTDLKDKWRNMAKMK